MEPPSTARSRNASRSDTSHKHWTFGPANAQSTQILPCLTEKPHPVSPHDPFDSCFAVAALAQQVGNRLQVGNRVEVERRLLASEAAVQVRADGGVPGVAGQLAHVVDVVHHRFKLYACFLRRSFAALP